MILAYYKNIATINARIFVFDSLGTKVFENQLRENYTIKELGNRIFVFGNYLCVLENNISLNIIPLS